MINTASFKLFVILVLLVVSFIPNDAYAAISCNGNYEATTDRVDMDNTSMAGRPRTGLVDRLITCLEDNINAATITIFADVRALLVDYVGALLVLYFSFFVIRAMFGAMKGNTASFGQVIVMLFTIALVNEFATTPLLDDYIDIFKGAQKELIEVVTSSLDRAGGVDTCSVPTNADATVAGLAPANEYSLWQKLDCLIGYLIGYSPEEFYAATGGSGPARDGISDMAKDPFYEQVYPNAYIAVIAFGLLFSPIGIFILLLALIVILTFLGIIAQLLYIYITSFLAVTILGLLAPIIIPLYMFPWTKGIFDGWISMLIGYTLMPAIVMAYMTFMVHAINYAIEGPCGGTVKCGYSAQLVESKTTAIKDQRSMLTMSDSTVENSTTTGSLTSSTAGASQGELLIPEIRFRGGHEAKEQYWMQNNIVLAIMLLLTISFMDNVMKFGAKMTGVVVEPIGKINLSAAAINVGTKIIAKRAGR